MANESKADAKAAKASEPDAVDTVCAALDDGKFDPHALAAALRELAGK